MAMQSLAREKRIAVIGALCEGLSVNATVSPTGVAKTTVLRLLVDMARVCMNWEDAHLRVLYCVEIEAEESWGFNYCKAKTLPMAQTPAEGAGDVWTWYAVDRRSKAILTWMMGDRDPAHAHAFVQDLASRLIGRTELSTDALALYSMAVFDAFQTAIDYGQVHKVFKTTTPDASRLPGAVCIGCDKRSIIGSPRLERIGTSRIERANLTLRTQQRRWTRRTNAHSKAFANMRAAFAFYSCFYNWARPHASLGGKTPAMVLGVTDRVWKVTDMVALLEADERAVIGTEENKRGPYRPRNPPKSAD